jgi:hypothetical protein
MSFADGFLAAQKIRQAKEDAKLKKQEAALNEKLLNLKIAEFQSKQQQQAEELMQAELLQRGRQEAGAASSLLQDDPFMHPSWAPGQAEGQPPGSQGGTGGVQQAPMPGPDAALEVRPMAHGRQQAPTLGKNPALRYSPKLEQMYQPDIHRYPLTPEMSPLWHGPAAPLVGPGVAPRVTPSTHVGPGAPVAATSLPLHAGPNTVTPGSPSSPQQGQVVGRLASGKPILRYGSGIATHKNAIVNIDGQEAVIPTIIGGRERSLDEAVALVQQAGMRDPDTGEPIRSFNTVAEAQAYEQQFRAQQRLDDPNLLRQGGLPSGPATVTPGGTSYSAYDRAVLSSPTPQSGIQLDDESRAQLQRILQRQRAAEPKFEQGNATLSAGQTRIDPFGNTIAQTPSKRLQEMKEDFQRRGEMVQAFEPLMTDLTPGQRGFANAALEAYRTGGINDEQLLKALDRLTGSGSVPSTSMGLAFLAAGTGPMAEQARKALRLLPQKQLNMTASELAYRAEGQGDDAERAQRALDQLRRLRETGVAGGRRRSRREPPPPVDVDGAGQAPGRPPKDPTFQGKKFEGRSGPQPRIKSFKRVE